MSAEKCAIIADSRPFFQYSHPNTIPPMPLSNSERSIIIGVIVVIAEVIGKWPNPNIIAVIIIEVHIIILFSIIFPFGFIIRLNNQMNKLIKNSLITISSLMPP